MLLTVAIALGCGSSASTSAPPGTGGSGQPELDAGGGQDANLDGTSSGAIPIALANIEGTAEDAYDMALANKPSAVAADAAELDADWKSYRSQAEADGATAATLSAVDDAIAALGAHSGADTPESLARLANAVSAPMPILYALYKPAVPTELLELDYRGRELELDGKAANLDTATTDLAKLRATWTSLKPAVLSAGGTTQAADYGATIEAMDSDIAAANGTKLAMDAVVGLELVDAMESLFAK
jgi:hypothetical protein